MNSLRILAALILAALASGGTLATGEERHWDDRPEKADSVFILPVEYTCAPGDNGLRGPEEVRKNEVYANVTRAEMKVYLPKSETPTSCVVIFPGGGYEGVWIGNVGVPGAEFFINNGIAAVVVKYRLPNGHIEVPVLDGQQAIKMVRMNAGKWNIDPEKIGICGSSAGGHLASMLAVHHSPADPSSKNELDHYTSRPDFVILLKAVIYESKGGTMSNSLGPDPSEEKQRYCNALNYVTPALAPTFIAHCYDDPAAPCPGMVEFFLALKKAGVPAEMHIYASGGHGISFWDKGKPMDEWMEALLRWKWLR